MYLTSWDDKGYIKDIDGMPKETVVKTCWKGYSFDIINSLTDNGYLQYSKYKNKSITLTPEGEKLAKELFKKYIEKE